MNLQELASEVAKREGLKSQARIYDIREILGIVADVMFEIPAVKDELIKAGILRAKRKKSAAKK